MTTCGLIAIAGAVFATPQSGPAEFKLLGQLPGGRNSGALAVSPDGTAVSGAAFAASGRLEPFLWQASRGMQPLELPKDTLVALAYCVSNAGAVVPGTLVLTERTQGAVWQRGESLQFLPYLAGGGSHSGASGVSGDGRFVSGASDSSRARQEPTRWELDIGAVISVGGLPGGGHHGALGRLSHDGATGVGTAASSPGLQAFLWREGAAPRGLGDLPGGTFESRATSLAAHGTVVVGYSESARGVEAFRWAETSGMMGLGDLPGGVFASTAQGVSDDGWRIVGTGRLGSFADPTDAFLWDPVRGVRLLQDVLKDLGIDLGGWRLPTATDISADGTVIVGNVLKEAGVGEAYLIRIPPFCYADCDDSSGRAVLDLGDFLEFQRRFTLQDLYSDCDQNGVHDLFDFLCFQNAFAAGCP